MSGKRSEKMKLYLVLHPVRLEIMLPFCMEILSVISP
jgi:hypothetical protein